MPTVQSRRELRQVLVPPADVHAVIVGPTGHFHGEATFCAECAEVLRRHGWTYAQRLVEETFVEQTGQVIEARVLPPEDAPAPAPPPGMDRKAALRAMLDDPAWRDALQELLAERATQKAEALQAKRQKK